MLDSETTRAWRKLQREVRENVPIILRGLASLAKRVPRKAYSSAVRSSKSFIRRAKGWEIGSGSRKALGSQLSRVRLRSPIYKV